MQAVAEKEEEEKGKRNQCWAKRQLLTSINYLECSTAKTKRKGWSIYNGKNEQEIRLFKSRAMFSKKTAVGSNCTNCLQMQHKKKTKRSLSDNLWATPARQVWPGTILYSSGSVANPDRQSRSSPQVMVHQPGLSACLLISKDAAVRSYRTDPVQVKSWCMAPELSF